jgi:hypothetical protein
MKTKAIHIQYHFVRDMVEDGKVILDKVETMHNFVDVLKKSVNTCKFKW